MVLYIGLIAKSCRQVLSLFDNYCCILSRTWCIGEYGEMLLPGSGGPLADGETSIPASESEIVDLLNGLLGYNDASKQYILTALMKLSAKLSTQVERIKQIVKNYGEHTMLEVQQRSCEYLKIFDYSEVC